MSRRRRRAPAVARTALALAAVLLSACSREPAAPEAQAPARPALWRVSDSDTTIYLFGSLHMLPEQMTWRSAAVDAAFAESSTVFFEADVAGDPDQMTRLVDDVGRLPAQESLSGMLSDEQSSRLGIVAARLGLSRPALESMRAWYAAVVISDAAIRAAGYGSDAGVDAQLREMASLSGKQLRYLESLEQQLSALANLPDSVQIAYLDLVVAEADSAKAALARMVGAWRAGDIDALATALITDDIARLPELEAALLTRRNADWSRQIVALLASEPGTFFVTVGAAHLAGGASVLTDLGTSGHAATRIQ